MEDARIVDLYWERSELAISETQIKYGKMLLSLSSSLTGDRSDAEECVNDTYLAAWNSMPEERPSLLGAFLAKITRRLSIDRFRFTHAEKRGSGTLTEELTECVPDTTSGVEREFENGMLKEALDNFLCSLDTVSRALFVQRYFWSYPLREIAKKNGMSETAVKVALFRLRARLKSVLEKEELL